MHVESALVAPAAAPATGPLPGAPLPALSPVPAPPAPVPAWAPAPVPPAPPLYEFQQEGVRFLLERESALLADEMGLGKSVQAIAAIQELFRTGRVSRVLVLCPKSLLTDWSRKFRRWAPELVVCAIQGPPARRTWDWRWPRAQVFICGYETWRVDCAEASAQPFDLVVLDEVQRIKNPGTLAAQAVHMLRVPRRWALSGTPLENCIEELMAVFYYLRPGLLEGEILLSTSRIKGAVRPYLLRRRKDEVMPFLPPKLHREVWLDLTEPQRRLYKRLEGEGLEALLGVAPGGAYGHLFGLLTRLKEVCNLEEQSLASSKLDFLLQDLGRIVAAGEKALVFSQYPEKTLRLLLPRMGAFRPVLFSGELGQWQRDELVRRFEEEEEPRVMLMSLKAGGVGLTLTRANHVYHFDHWWNPAAASQAEDRVHRIGQHRPVYVTSLLTRDTVEERIARLLQQKRELFAEIMEDHPAPRLDKEALWELFGFAGRIH